jgi:hypothetical protein
LVLGVCEGIEFATRQELLNRFSNGQALFAFGGKPFPLLRALFDGVDASPDLLAGRSRRFARRSERHVGKASQSDVAPFTLDDSTKDPRSTSSIVDTQVQTGHASDSVKAWLD